LVACAAHPAAQDDSVTSTVRQMAAMRLVMASSETVAALWRARFEPPNAMLRDALAVFLTRQSRQSS
jgi:hypothetical protein